MPITRYGTKKIILTRGWNRVWGLIGCHPALRKIIQKRTSRKMPTLFWVDVRDYTLWKKAGVKSRGLDKMSGGGITINAVFESIVEYERR